MLGENRPKLETGGNFEAFSSGLYTLQIADINTAMESYQNNAPEEKFKFTFFVLNDNKFKNAEGKEVTTKGRKLWKSFSKYVSPKANLFQFIILLDPNFANLSTEEKQNYNLDDLIGKQINALVSKDKSKTTDISYNNIKSFEKCETELEGIEDLPGKPVVTNKESVPVTAPEEPTSESSEDFVKNLEKQSSEFKSEKTEVTQPELKEETEQEKKIREANEAIAKIKADAGIKD
ncbi:MAG: hypothetical protein PHO75_02280 [Candidatus Shapirobacteria bacterium]|nr:hypothetical protein [Candidatus Shapirobacteria bacterium]